MVQGVGYALDTLEKRHWYALHTSSRLTTYFRQMHQPRAAKVTPERVIRVFNSAGIPCVLIGTHALGTWRSEPRATQDVDLLVRRRDLAAAAGVLQKAYPKLAIQDCPMVTRFIDRSTGKEVIDLMKPANAVLREVFRQTIPIGATHAIPNLEMCLVSKFATMISPSRPLSKWYLDAGDFMDVVIHNRDILGLRKLRRLAAMVYFGGGEKISRIVRDIDAGRTIQL